MCICNFFITHSTWIILLIVGIGFMNMAWEIHQESERLKNCCAFAVKHCETSRETCVEAP